MVALSTGRYAGSSVEEDDEEDEYWPAFAPRNVCLLLAHQNRMPYDGISLIRQAGEGAVLIPLKVNKFCFDRQYGIKHMCQKRQNGISQRCDLAFCRADWFILLPDCFRNFLC